MALAKFKLSGNYLAATHFPPGLANKSIVFQRLDLTQWLGEPIEVVNDGFEPGCKLALWRLT